MATDSVSSGYTRVPLTNVLINSVSGTPGYSGDPNAVIEVSLDIELIIAMAPGLSEVVDTGDALALGLGFGQGWHEQSRQNGNNSDHDQQLDQSEAVSRRAPGIRFVRATGN